MSEFDSFLRTGDPSGMETAAKQNPTKPGSVFTKIISRGPNKGDKVKFRVAPGGNPYPIRVVTDRGGNSTLRGDIPGAGKKKKKK